MFWNFHPEPWGKMNPFWPSYFSDGLVQPPTWKTARGNGTSNNSHFDIPWPAPRISYQRAKGGDFPEENMSETLLLPTRFFYFLYIYTTNIEFLKIPPWLSTVFSIEEIRHDFAVGPDWSCCTFGGVGFNRCVLEGPWDWSQKNNTHRWMVQ